MTKLMCINATQENEPRIAVVENQRLISLETQQYDHTRSCGNVILGVISSIQEGIDAVFVDIGSQRHGFLPFKEIMPSCYQAEKTESSTIHDLIQVGQTVLVQVTREEKPNKGSALTTYISLAGAYLVLMPNNQKNNGISKKADAAERLKTKEIVSKLNIPESLSIIVRTEGLNRCKEELAWDLECLLHHWNKVHEAAKTVKTPTLIHEESDALIRSVRDRLRKNIDSIVIDHEPTFIKLKDYLQKTRPEFEERISLYTNAKTVPLFSHYGLQGQIQSLFARKIELKSGGSIVIDYAEAMTVIDVNSARSKGSKNIEDTAFTTNSEALYEIIRQMSLRDIGGIITVDFIDMSNEDNRKKIEDLVAQKIQKDQLKIRFEPISLLTGCMLLSRQRTGPSIVDQHYEECSHCNGLGYTRSIHSVASNILFKIEEICASEASKTLVIHTSDDVGCYLLNEKRGQIETLEKRFNIKAIIIPSTALINEKYSIKRVSESNRSYQQRTVKPQNNTRPKWSKQQQSKPLVPNQLYKEHPNTRSGGVLQRIMDKIMSSNTPEQKEERKSPSANKQGHNNRSNHHKNSDQSERRNKRTRNNAHMRRGNRKRPHGENKNKSQDSPDRMDD